MFVILIDRMASQSASKAAYEHSGRRMDIARNVHEHARDSKPGACEATPKQHRQLDTVGFTVQISLLDRYIGRRIMAFSHAEICLHLFSAAYRRFAPMGGSCCRKLLNLFFLL
jgi:hypothetical protein